jgi:MIP family channel proteins
VRRLVAEAIGTFFLVLIGPGAVMVSAGTGIALAFAFVVTAMVYVFGDISGAHINPAVTIGLWSARRFPGRDVIPYIAAQCVGAIAASAVLRATIGPVGNLGATLPAVPIPAAFAIEWLLSFGLMLVILAPRSTPLAIGLTVGFCALTGGPLTGASMNPARSVGPALVAGLWRAHWIYWIAPITAMIAAGRLFAWVAEARVRREYEAGLDLPATRSPDHATLATLARPPLEPCPTPPPAPTESYRA